MSEFYKSREWRDIRYRVLVKYGKKCMLCNETNKVIHVDHIRPISKYPELKLDFSNLQVLCEDCNLGKSNKDETDFRPIKTRIRIVKKIDYTGKIEGARGFLIRGEKIAHVWDGKDTSCRIWSGAGFSFGKRYQLKGDNSENIKLCKICKKINRL